MARRMEIELTSQRDDDTWTWRAAGARQPKGTLDAGLLPPAAKVGDVVRAEVEGFLDGMTVVSVLPPKAPRQEPERLELLTPRSDNRLVTTSGGTRTGRGRTERPRRGERPSRGDRDHGRRRPERERPRGGRERSRDHDRDHERERAPMGEGGPAAEAKPKPKRLRPAKVHRTALLEALPAEQRPIAEQLLQGGIPAVRQAIEKQNETLKNEGKTQVNPEPLLEIAEKLRNRAQAATWRDRADAALAHVDELDLRDLRSVVNAAEDAGRDEEARNLAHQLREALANRVEKEQAAWVSEIADNLREGRIVRALRLTSRPPKAGSPVPADLAEQIIVGTSEALTADTGPQRWATVLDALAYSPIRRRVVPASLPEKVAPDLRETIARLATRLPEIAHIFDITPAPTTSRPPRPPRRRSGGKKTGGDAKGPGGSGRGGRRGGGGGAAGSEEATPANGQAMANGTAEPDAGKVDAEADAGPAEEATGTPVDTATSDATASDATGNGASSDAVDANDAEAVAGPSPETSEPGTDELQSSQLESREPEASEPETPSEQGGDQDDQVSASAPEG